MRSVAFCVNKTEFVQHVIKNLVKFVLPKYIYN